MPAPCSTKSDPCGLKITVAPDLGSAVESIEARRKRRDQEIAARLQREARLHPPSTTIVRYERHSYLLNFVPFGAGQFQNDQRRKGWLFFGVETALAAISVSAFTTNFALYGANPYRKCLQPPGSTGPCPTADIDHSQEETSRALLRLQVISGGLFFAAAIWGVYDAIRHYQRDVPFGEAPGPPGGTARLLLGPTGVGAAWTF